jgi:hypothetical protein
MFSPFTVTIVPPSTDPRAGAMRVMRGAALQAYFEAGDVETVSAWFRKVLSANHSDPCEMLRHIPVDFVKLDGNLVRVLNAHVEKQNGAEAA